LKCLPIFCFVKSVIGGCNSYVRILLWLVALLVRSDVFVAQMLLNILNVVLMSFVFFLELLDPCLHGGGEDKLVRQEARTCSSSHFLSTSETLSYMSMSGIWVRALPGPMRHGLKTGPFCPMFYTKLKEPFSFTKVPDGPSPNILRVQKEGTQIRMSE